MKAPRSSAPGAPSASDAGSPTPPLLALVGPTAVGKTGLSLAVAEAVREQVGRTVEIVSADSRQVYRHLTIGTAKPDADERAHTRHHFIDEKDPDAPFSAGRFAEEAELRIGDILARDHLPLIVGGSTLYAEALFHGLAEIPQTTPATRQALTERLAREGAARLYAELIDIDPQAAATMDATKSQRIVRALEVYLDTGHPLSHWQRRVRPPRYVYDVVVLERPRPELYARIEQRVDSMLRDGLVDEARSLIERGYSPTLPALQTIGYREPFAFLRGEISYDEMVRLLKQNTRRYAKRQLTWFRRRSAYAWIDLSASNSSALASQLATRMGVDI